MKTSTHHSRGVRLERAMIAFFILATTSLLVVYIAAPAIYAQSLALTSSPADRYPVPVTLFLVGILAVVSLLILGVVRHWRWVFWLMLLAFASSALQIPATLLQITHVLPSTGPLWYSLFRMGVALVEVGIAIWMVQIYRREGVWALGKKRNER